jgi:flotillin
MFDAFLGVGAVAAFLLIILSTLVYISSRYKRCPSDKILVVYGRVDKGRSSRCMHGGGALIWPLVQDYAFSQPDTDDH